ncbi:unnamed protein product [Haemonchus placei]|uniref:Uncharacterized protein n=1 Tax=Haemonchus placei TaxID=6290 RepID=A0A3P7XSU0_HAEPC|nr:unnamed protein product [Haemonchus placei]
MCNSIRNLSSTSTDMCRTRGGVNLVRRFVVRRSERGSEVDTVSTWTDTFSLYMDCSTTPPDLFDFHYTSIQSGIRGVSQFSVLSKFVFQWSLTWIGTLPYSPKSIVYNVAPYGIDLLGTDYFFIQIGAGIVLTKREKCSPS